MSDSSVVELAGQITTLNETVLQIDANCAQAWEVFLDRQRWTENVVSYKSLSGKRGETGERALVRSDVMGEILDRYEQVLLSQPPCRMVIAVQAPAAKTTAFADYRLEPRLGGCKLSLSLVLVARLSTSTDIAAVSASIVQGTQAKIELDLRRLKALAEAETKS